MKTTLSNTQWQHLQALFDRAEQMDKSAADALVASLRQDDALIAETLSAMLSAHRQWQQRTGAAIETLAAAASPSAVGARLGAFTLVKEIGRGGMGTVYLGERADGQVQQQVAIKVLHARNLDDNTRARFQREREILASFDHPGIARLLDVGESEAGEPYYVMEYLRGLPIDAHCDQHRLSIRERLNLFRDICDAVQYAHGKLILHRDIKPSNIIVDAAGVPKLIDFGIAKPMQLLDAAAAEETAAQHRYFSPVNAAPEQIRGESVSVACDVYQLGTLLHELLCGRPIFEWQGSSVSDLERKISAITPDAPSVVAATATDAVLQARALASPQALVRAVSGDLDAIVQRAVRKEPQLRYASVEQLSQDVERHLQDQPVLGRRGERAYRFSRFVKRNRRAIGVSAAAVVGVAVFTALLFRQVQQTTAERDRAVAASKRAEAVTDFLLETFRSGDPAVAKRSKVSIGEALDRAQGLLATKLSTQPEIRATVSATLADIYVSLGQFEPAEKLSAEALSLLQSVPAIEPAAVIGQMQQYANMLLNRAKYAEFESLVLRLRQLDDTQPPDLLRSWRTRLLEAQVLLRKDEDAACKDIESLANSLDAISTQIPQGYAEVQISVASCAPQDADWYIRRLRGLSRALVVVEKEMGADAPLLMDLKYRKAVSLKKIRRFSEALALYQALLGQQEQVYGPESLAVANTLLGISGTQIEIEDYNGSLATLQRAYPIFAAVHGDAPNGDLAQVSYNLGIVYDYGGIDRHKAAEWYGKAYEISLQAYGQNARSVGSFATDYGTMLRRIGEYEKAEPVLRIARHNMSLETSYGFLARLSLAIVLSKRQAWDEVRSLIAECESGNPAYPQDPYFKEDWDGLRAELARHSKS